MSDFDAMNAAYVEKIGMQRPARTVVGVRELPKPGVLLTMKSHRSNGGFARGCCQTGSVWSDFLDSGDLRR